MSDNIAVHFSYVTPTRVSGSILVDQDELLFLSAKNDLNQLGPVDYEAYVRGKLDLKDATWFKTDTVKTVGKFWCYSMTGMCEKSPDTRHAWYKIADGGQSNELFECAHCDKQTWD